MTVRRASDVIHAGNNLAFFFELFDDMSGVIQNSKPYLVQKVDRSSDYFISFLCCLRWRAKIEIN